MFELLIPLLGKVLDKVLPDPAAAAAAKMKILEMYQNGELTEFKSAADIVKAEASSTNWLTSAWRPITMLTFVFIIANNYILFPYMQLFIHTGVALTLPPDMWALLKIGLGGYVIGRSVEKSVSAYKGK
ncbi:MAG: 3TM-type holin [Acidiferrobacteraceae bacterium]